MGATSSVLMHVPAKTTGLLIPGISLHFDDMSDQLRLLLDGSVYTEVSAIAKAKGIDGDLIVGKSKSDPESLKKYQEFFAKDVRNKHLLPPNYKFFGDGNNKENLKYFLKTNGFFTSAISAARDSSGNLQFAVNTLGTEHPTWYSKAVVGYDVSYPRVNAIFDDQFNLVSYQVFINGEDKTADVDETHALQYLSVTLLYFAQVTHTTIHIFELIMASAVLDATEHDDLQLKWAKPYSLNLYAKYVEVDKLLMTKEGALTTKTFRSDYDHVIAYAKELLTAWLHCHSADAFLRSFLFSGIQDAAVVDQLLAPEHDLVLSEWRKHAALAKPYGQELCDAFNRRRPGTVEKTDAALTAYLHKVGEGVADISSLQSWIELMSVFGLLHGNTLSMSRFLISPTILGALTPSEDTFTKRDFNTLALVTGTITGTHDGRHVYSSELWSENDQQLRHPLLKAVLKKYDAATTQLQSAYYEHLRATPEHFADYGWILSDYCLEGIDAKQMTLTTYI